MNAFTMKYCNKIITIIPPPRSTVALVLAHFSFFHFLFVNCVYSCVRRFHVFFRQFHSLNSLSLMGSDGDGGVGEYTFRGGNFLPFEYCVCSMHALLVGSGLFSVRFQCTKREANHISVEFEQSSDIDARAPSVCDFF